MKCFRCFSFPLFALLGVFFGSFIINQNNTYAVNDSSVTVTSSNYSDNSYLCSSQSDCSQYHYLLIQGSNFSGTSNIVGYYVECSPIGYSKFSFYFYPYRQSFMLISLDSPISNSNISSCRIYPYNVYSTSDFTNNFGSDYSLTFTLSENNPFSGGGLTPSGSIELTENGTYDVTNYAEAVVNVPETDCPPSSGGGGNYHDDLVAINNSIIICAATCLVIYFFYCIYRMIIKNSGVK